MTNSRQRRGRETEFAVARYMAENGWPYALAVASGAGGVDVTGVPGLSVEVKARAGFDPMAWLRQARKRPGLPFAVMRCNGQGTTRPGEYVALIPFEQLVQLLRAAGYGDPLEEAS